MQKKIKKWALFLLCIPAFAMAQGLSNQTSEAHSKTVLEPVTDTAKVKAIKDLLKAIDAEKLSEAIGERAQMEAKQLVPAILSDALAENKTFTDKQKAAAVPNLQKNAIPKLVDSAGHIFASPNFKQDATDAQLKAYAKHYSLQEIKDLTAFYTSSTGKKFIAVQDQVGRDVVNSLMEKYMTESIKATRIEADKDVATIKPSTSNVKHK